MRRGLIVMTLFLATSTAAAAAAKNETRRLVDAASVIRELRSTPDRAIPDSIWNAPGAWP
jgi:hypothetical protein